MKEFLAAKINQDDEARDEVKKQEEKNKYDEKEKYVEKEEKEEYVENKWVIVENEEGGGHSVERFENDKETIEDDFIVHLGVPLQ